MMEIINLCLLFIHGFKTKCFCYIQQIVIKTPVLNFFVFKIDIIYIWKSILQVSTPWIHFPNCVFGLSWITTQ